MPQAPVWFAVLGERGSGKTTQLVRIAERLRDAGLRVGGVLQLPEGEGLPRSGYRLLDLATGEERPFAHFRPPPTPEELAYVFEPAGWAWARERVARARLEADVLLLDELGRLEARGEGHLPALSQPLEEERARAWVLGVRDLALPAVRAALGSSRAVLHLPASLPEEARWWDALWAALGR